MIFKFHKWYDDVVHELWKEVISIVAVLMIIGASDSSFVIIKFGAIGLIFLFIISRFFWKYKKIKSRDKEKK